MDLLPKKTLIILPSPDSRMLTSL
ncbi:hypothetical protein CCACVL1_06917 [Corchorus capsularis]|uniref:Uncharacterized protein n=1 Tax=Corchorus capsularis TaxID=210143 RepID=A0A1R3JBC0_COCAP|nr:hypothetical protein CCACVL1_06917 [Corchorus capsularis]